MKIQIDVNTPKNQAAACIETQKDALIGITKRKKIIEQKVTSHDHFYWILEIEPKELDDIYKKCSKGEVIIKKFYSTLFKIIGRANKLAVKFNKGIHWIKKWIKKKLDKVSQDNQDMKNHIDSMTDKQFMEWIKITDREPMEKLLKGNLIEIKIIDQDSSKLTK